jgi:hypothetical protein
MSASPRPSRVTVTRNHCDRVAIRMSPVQYRLLYQIVQCGFEQSFLGWPIEPPARALRDSLSEGKQRLGL